MSTESLCATPKPGYASCAAEALVSRQNHALIHPRRERSYSVYRTRLSALAALAHPQLDTAQTNGAQSDTEPAAAPLPQAGTPAFLQQAYDLTYLSETAGGSATVGIVDAYYDPTAATDLATFRSNYGLPACTTANGCLTVDAQTSTTNTGWGGEVSLDLDAVSAICPNCHIVLVEAPSASLSDLTNAIQTAHQLGATYISNSWGEDGGSLPDSGFSFAGSTTFASAGDSGYTGSPQYPAALPDVTAIGGTTLTYAPQTPRGYTESVWNGTGSGCDTGQSKPSWQTGDNTGCNGRSYNDISADADPNTGLDVYDSGYGGWVLVGGTSLSSPLTAAYYALIGNAGVTDAWPYQHASLLNDVTAGNDVDASDRDPQCTSDPGICQSGVGFDGPTGNGTISGDAVTGAPGVGSNGYSAGVEGSSATITVGVYPNGADTHVHLEYGPSGQGYTAQTSADDIGAGVSAVQTTFTVTGVAAGYHYRVVASNSYGTTYGYDVSLANDTGSPAVTGASITATTATSAQASFSVNYNGSGSVEVEYGPTAAYGLTTASESGSGEQSVSLTLTGLQPSTTYHWAVVVTNGTGTSTTADATFTTAAGSSTAGSAGSGGSTSGSSGGPPGGGPSTGGGSTAGGGSTPGGGSTTGGVPSSKGLTVTSVTASGGHYDIRVTCRAAPGCVGHVTLIQHLPANRTHVLGTAAVALKAGAATTIRFRTNAKPPVAIAVAARSTVEGARRSPARSRPPGASSGRRR